MTEKTESKKEKRERKELKKAKTTSKSKDHDEAEAKGSEDEEIEIDLQADTPLSKKEKRLLKKGKITLEEIRKKQPLVVPENSAETSTEETKKSTKSEFGVWIGNLSFDTTSEDIVRFITAKTSSFVSLEESQNDSDSVKVEESDISRVNLPKKEKKIKGFAYVDLPSIKHVNTVISLSESQLNGRNLLIKNANSFEGRPSKEETALSKNPPSRILFVGNLSFDTTEELLEEHFRHCGDIVRIRMATFEDTNKCKGFAFIDFKDESGPTTALKSKLAKKFINRPLRLEYGEDRSKRNPNQKKKTAEDLQDVQTDEPSFEPPSRVRSAPVARERPSFQRSAPVKRYRDDDHNSSKRLKSSVALATAQRASAAIVPSKGKKVVFD